MEFLIVEDIFSIFLLKLEIYIENILKTKITNQFNFFIHRVSYFWNQWPLRSRIAIV